MSRTAQRTGRSAQPGALDLSRRAQCRQGSARSAWRRRARPLGENAEASIPALVVSTPADTLEEKESLEQLRTALLDLRPEEKAVFLLRQNGDLTYEEIAEFRRCPVGTVKTQMRAALQKLRRVLKDK